MAPRAKCPNCGNIRIDKGTLRKATSGTETVWFADCPICGQTLNSLEKDEVFNLIDKTKDLINKSRPYSVREEDILTAPDDDSAEVKYITKKNKAKL